MKEKRFVGFYNKSVILTYISLGSAFVSMFMSLHREFRLAILFLLFSGFCDMFDGAIARKMKRTELEKGFGIQIDSLCDLVCFGVTPAILTVALYNGSRFQLLGYAAGFLLTLGGVIRLAYFNVTEEARQKETSERRTVYQGLPITCSSLAVPFAYVVGRLLPDRVMPYFFSGFMVFVAFLFIFIFPVPKVHGKGSIPVIIGALLLLLGVLLV
ncbi:MAG: CDP-alcohol phosphatidyltransferase family protein [Lachnospiraceae bacterium]|nr:CDP-alcohol phosphatidyltransferase family protein [Lachnospiraceae bacterium]